MNSPLLICVPFKNSSIDNLFFPSFWISKIFKDLSLQPIIKFLFIISPGLPICSLISAFQILNRELLNLNQAPGFGFKLLILASIVF